MKKRFTLFIICIAGLTSLSQSQSTQQTEKNNLTLDKAISIALQNNRDILIADQDRYKAEAQISEARSGAFPQINLSGQYSRNFQKPVMFLPPGTPFNKSDSPMKFEIGTDNSYSASLQLYQTLFNKKVGTALSIAEIYHDYSEKTYEGTTLDVILNVKKSFYSVLLSSKLVDVARDGLDVVRVNYENIKSLYNHGSAAEYDLLRAEVQVANTEPILTQAENSYSLAKDALKNLLAIDLKQDIKVIGEFDFQEVPVDIIQQANQQALSANPTLTQLSLQESLMEKNIDIERASYFPSLALFGTYQWLTQDNTFQFRNYNWAQTFTVGLQLSYALFDGLRTGARSEQATIDRNKIQYTRLKVEEGIKIQIQSSQMRMNEAKQRIIGQEKSIEQATKALKIAQTRYKNGVSTQLELLDTQAALTRTKTNYAQAIYDYLIAKAEWERAVGFKQTTHTNNED
jgi:outer membrane protein